MRRRPMYQATRLPSRWPRFKASCCWSRRAPHGLRNGLMRCAPRAFPRWASCREAANTRCGGAENRTEVAGHRHMSNRRRLTDAEFAELRALANAQCETIVTDYLGKPLKRSRREMRWGDGT